MSSSDLVICRSATEHATTKGIVLGANTSKANWFTSSASSCVPEATPGKKNVKFTAQLPGLRAPRQDGGCLPDKVLDLDATLTVGNEVVPVTPNMSAC